MENKASDRDSQWRQCSLLLGGVGVALSSFSSMIWLPSLLALIDCFLFSHLTGCEDLFNGRPTAHITPMNLYFSLILSCIGLLALMDVPHFWRMRKRDPEPTVIAQTTPCKVFGWVLLHYLALTSIFVILGVLIPQIPYWLTILFNLDVEALFERYGSLGFHYSGIELTFSIMALGFLIFALRLTRRVRNELVASPLVPILIEDGSIHVYTRK